jgi:hypothetical protein
MTKPPAVVAAPNYPVDCTSSRAAPVLDTICAAYFAVNGLLVASTTSCENASPGERCITSSNKTGAVLLDVGLVALCAASAASGYGMATRCGVVKDANALCITGHEASCRQLNSRWTPPMRLPADAPGAAPQAAPTPAAEPSLPASPPQGENCSKNRDCTGNRICERGACVEPGSSLVPAAP